MRRVYALEYIWQTLKADQLHFVPAKKGYILRLPTTIAPFVVNSRLALPIVEKMFQGLDLRLGKGWAYDPREIISNKIKRNKSAPYMHEPRPFMEWRANIEIWPLISQMETDSSATGEEEDVNKGTGGEEEGTSGAVSPHKKQKTASSEAEVIVEEQLLEPFTTYGKLDTSKAGIKVLRDSTTSSDFTEVTQAIIEHTSPRAVERDRANRAIRDKYKDELEGYVEKYHTRVSASMNVDTEHLVLSMEEILLDPNSGVTSYRVLEHAIDMKKVPAIDLCNLFQTVCDMLKDEMMWVTLALKKLEEKHEHVRATLKNE